MKFGEAIAIVGLGGVFPGALSLEGFWEVIAAGRDTSRPAPPGRWRLNPASILHPTPGTPDRVYTDHACFIEGFSLDPTGLGLDRDLLAQLDPVVHLLLAAGRDAFASARIDSLDRTRIGVTLGHIALPTESSSNLCEEILAPLLERATFGTAASSGFNTHPLNRYAAGLPAGILAQALGLGGGTRTLDAACASSLYALKLACDELHAGRADAMLAGGVSRPDSLYTQMGFAQLRALATSGRCTPFDAAASGLIVGEGAGVVVLKRLGDALRDGDQIHALIRGIGLSNDLDGNLLSPASEGQLRALRLAYDAAGWEPESVEFIECHATGTPVGDAVEFSSLSQLWSGRTWQPGQCTLGAVKANIGHLLTGAGAAGLLKVLLALRHNTLPPVANFQRAGDHIPLSQSPFRVLTQSQPWEKRADGRPRRAAINGFGFGGINAHVLIEEWTTPPASERAPFAPSVTTVQSPIAIIGLATHIGPWKDLRSFAARVLGVDTETQPQVRPDWRGLASDPLASQPGYFVDDLAIPVSRYRIPPRELAELLPQQALMLEVARDALDDAHKTHPHATRTGVFIGLGLDLRTTDFHFRWAMLDRAGDWAQRLPADVSEQDQAAWAARLVDAAGPPLNADRTMGALAGTNASRIAKEFRIGGQSYTVCSEDTSGLSALEIAVRALQRGELDLALAGGVELTGDLRTQLAESALGRSQLHGEGAVAVVLKRLDDARRDGDRIYAVIRGLGVGNSLEHACARSRREAGFEHATPLPSARKDVGHTGAASGLVDLAKAAIALHGQGLPQGSDLPSLHSPANRADVTASSVDGNCYSVLLEAVESRPTDRVDGEGPGQGTAVAAVGQPRALSSGLATGVEPWSNAGEVKSGLAPEGRTVAIAITGARIVVPALPKSGWRGEGDSPQRAAGRLQADAGEVYQGTPDGPEPRPVPSGRPVELQPDGKGAGVAADPFEAELLAAMAHAQTTALRAHEAYLSFSEGVFRTLSEAVLTQMEWVARAAGGVLPPPCSGRVKEGDTACGESSSSTGVVPRSLTRAQCFEFAIGKIGNALGSLFAEVDSFPTRVRLPDAPLQLVDRIMAIEGEPRSMTHGRVVTEHDVHPGAWYLDCGRIPTCIAVEAGQADLFLSGFLGIDFQTRGLAMYRLLDAKVCFHRSLPGPGETIRYDIRIERFFQQSGVWLFKFNFESTVGGQPLLTMTEGCAGFFTPQDLAAGKGIVRTALQLKPQPGRRPADWEDFVPMAVESYSAEQLDALRAGDLVRCFGEGFARLQLVQPVTLPGGRMRLVHRIERLEPTGGRFGLGLIRGEADIHPDDWFITCHFVDDRVMPGTLMYECCLHTLRVHLLRLGWVVEARPGVALEPVPGVAGQLKCRGQVLETTKRVTYEIEIKEIGYAPEPYVIAEALMYADGKPIVEIGNMSLRYTGVTREEICATWAHGERGAPNTEARPALKPTLFGPERIRAFSNGNPSEAFGEPYRIFDEGAARRIARLPRAPYQFLDRITDVRGCEAFQMVAGGEVEAHYDVPPDAWYFGANRQDDMPFAVLLEVALQPCGWLSAYLGSALTSREDLSYRNLGGTGTLFVPVRPDVGTLTTRIKNTRLSSSAGMIIQWFDFEVSAGSRRVYRGDTYFGFFPKSALEKQEGIKGATPYPPTPAELACAQSLAYPTAAPFADTMLRMVDAIPVWVPDGGPKRLGFIRGTKRVNPEEWFFRAHFYQDPVVPGSLGLESFLQLLKFAAVQRWAHAAGRRWEAVATNAKHEWVYRGQVIPRDNRVTVEAVVTACDDATLTLAADGFLSVDGRIIYGMKNFTVRGVSAS